jgi:hypothetical protein
MQSALFEFTNRVSNVKDLNYGKPKQTKPKLELSKTTIRQTCIDLVIRAIDLYLATPDVIRSTTYDTGVDESKDIVGQVLQRTSSDTTIDTTPPEIKKAQRIKVNQTDRDIKLEAEKEKELPPPPPPNVEPTPPPIYRKPIDVDYMGTPLHGGGGGGGSIYREYDTLDRQNLADGGMGKERIEYT